MKRLTVLFLLAAILVSCKGEPGNTETPSGERDHGTEATYFPAHDPDYRTCSNAKFGFWFDLPRGWRAVDRSAVGDGYFIECGEHGIDIRIYGMQREPNDDELFRTMVGDPEKVEPFSFRDGANGSVLFMDHIRYFVRSTPEVRVMLYVKADEAWYQKNKEIILAMARSIRFGNGGGAL
jgi:hypothetical protein